MPELLTQTEFARRVGVSRQRIQQLLDVGRLPVVQTSQGRRVPWAEAKAIWDADRGVVAQPAPEVGAEPAPSLDPATAPEPRRRMDIATIAAETAKARLVDKTEQAKMRRLRRELLEETIVNKAEVEADAENASLTIRSALQALPAKVAPMLEGLALAEIEAILTTEIDDALRALHEARFGPGGADGQATR